MAKDLLAPGWALVPEGWARASRHLSFSASGRQTGIGFFTGLSTATFALAMFSRKYMDQ